MFYIVKTNPAQKSEYGGTTYKGIAIHSNVNLLPEDLRILVNQYLKIPFHQKYVPLWEDAKKYVNNIKVDEYKYDLPSLRKYLEKLQDRFEVEEHYIVEYTQEGDYEVIFPKGFTFTSTEKGKFIKIVDDSIKRIQEKEHTKNQEDLKDRFKQMVKQLDKETILKMLLEETDNK